MASAAPGPQRQSPSPSPTPSADLEAPFPPPARASTLPVSIDGPRAAAPSHLSPDAAFYPNTSPPRRLAGYDNGEVSGNELRSSRRMHYKAPGDRSRSRRRRRAWKKLLWVKQTYPDNYTDQATFLENLQRNPRLQPYEFWPLVADFTVIVQHVCSVIIFVVCFVGIFQERVSPVAVVGLGSLATFLGWLLWDWWVMQETDDEDAAPGGLAHARSLSGRQFRPQRVLTGPAGGGGYDDTTTTRDTNSPLTANSSVSNLPSAMSSASNLHAALRPALPKSVSTTSLTAPRYVQSASATSLNSSTSRLSGSRFNASGSGTPTAAAATAADHPTSTELRHHHHRPSSPLRTERAHLRLGTIKSAVLIYFTLLGLSPILKSLTRSTSSDSIWAMSFWLLAVNIFFFDYSGDWGGVRRFPVASLSTNAALMASTVLASRLPSTGQVFSLTLFSIEVFGLAPVFRRYARHRSWRFHVVLTVLLVLGAGGGAGMILTRPSVGAGAGAGRWWPVCRGGLLGMVVGCAMAALAMGGCSWWLIGLQKYKNEIYGPWDPARPIIISRRHWDE